VICWKDLTRRGSALQPTLHEPAVVRNLLVAIVSHQNIDLLNWKVGAVVLLSFGGGADRDF